jgi:hypothetical protein
VQADGERERDEERGEREKKIEKNKIKLKRP